MEPSKVLELETRKNIFNLVNKYAGSNFRNLEKKIKLSPSSVKYHLDYLHKHDLIIEQKDGNSIRYFPKKLNNQNHQLLTQLRQNSIRKILLYLLNNNSANFKQITNFSNLSPSTVSWHLKKLKNKNAITTIKIDNQINYKLNIDPNELIQLLITYKESFLDSFVNKTLDMWDIK